MKAYRLFLVLLTLIFTSKGQINTTLIGQLSYDEELSDIWGYQDETGIEYALVGGHSEFSVVSLADPSNPVEVFSAPGPSTIWRDIKVWNDHAYITNEGGQGLLIVDLSPLPQSSNLDYLYFSDGWSTAHNLYIDENGVCYIFGADQNEGGAIMYDLTQDPEVPVLLGEVDWWYAHDGMARGDTLYMGNVNDGFFSITDVSDKSNPVLLATHNTSFNFTHNVWVSDDGNTLYTTDEKSAAFIGAYDISDLGNIEHLDDWQSSPGEGVIPHNTHFIDDYLVTSYYRDGLNVLDVTYPDNMIEVANYDEADDYEGNGFNGAWGAYPYLPSGLVLVSDIEKGLFVFDVNYQRACYLVGQVTDEGSGAPLSGVDVLIESVNVTDETEITGNYATGYHAGGTYNVTYSKLGYFPETVQVELVNGQQVVQDVALRIMTYTAVTADVVEQGSQTEIAGATMLVFDQDFIFEAVANQNGVFQLDTVFEGTYEVSVTQWGYLSYCGEITVDSTSNNFHFELNQGYQDDFATDLGWEVINSNNLDKGVWERVAPIGTIVDGVQSAPNEDVSGDCFTHAYVTGQTTSPADVGMDDLDPQGKVILKSPEMNLVWNENPVLNYYAWFYNQTWANPVNDSMLVFVTNGSDSVMVDFVTMSNSTPEEWQSRNVVLLDHISITNSMHVYVVIEDQPSNHLLEGGFDAFQISNGPLGVEEIAPNHLMFYPNPNQSEGMLNFNQKLAHACIFNMNGQKILEANHVDQLSLNDLSQGIYMVQMTDEKGRVEYGKLLITK